MLFKRELIDELVSGRDAREIFERNGLLDKLKEALAERLSQGAGRGGESNVTRLPTTRTLFNLDQSMLALDEDGDDLQSRYRLRFPGFDEQVAALFARGLAARDIQRRLEALYGVAIPHDVIAAHADTVLQEA